MFIALDEDGKRVKISESYRGERYHCPICHKPLIIKAGPKVAHHFAHRPGDRCFDSFHHDMSEWHHSWQDIFPEETQEVIFRQGDVVHRADVFLKEKNIIIEFQHSFLSRAEFSERNRFYLSCGYGLAWLFDMSEDYNENKITNIKGSSEKFKYLSPPQTFKDLILRSDITIYLQLSESDIVRLTWISPQGIRYFAAQHMTKDEFITGFIGGSAEKEMQINKPIFKKNSLLQLYEDAHSDIVIFQNRMTMKKVMLTSSPLIQYERYHQIYGKISDSFGEFSKGSVVIEDALRPIWKVIWKNDRRRGHGEQGEHESGTDQGGEGESQELPQSDNL